MSTRLLFLLVALALALIAPPAQTASPLDASDIAPPTLVGDINPGLIGLGSNIQQMSATNDRLFFTHYTADAGRELWVSDGTNEGTRMVGDFLPEGVGIDEIATTERRAYFSTAGPYYSSDSELWVSDGSSTGSRRVVTFSEGWQIWHIFGMKGSRDQVIVMTVGKELDAQIWRSDGTPEGTILLGVVDTVANRARPAQLQIGDTIYFIITHYPPDSRNPVTAFWATDGTATNTRNITSLTGIAEAFVGHIGSQLYFLLGNYGGTPKLWRSDGTAMGTTLIDLGSNGNLHTAAILGDRLITATRLSDTHLELREGATIFKTFFGEEVTRFSGFTTTAKHLFFTTGNEDRRPDGATRWVSDGTAVGTRSLARLVQGQQGGTWHDFISIDNQVFFVASDAVNGDELWVSDGSAAGTRRVSSIRAGSQQSPRIGSPIAVGGRLFFLANDLRHGEELWVSDGTSEGTALVADLNPETTPAPSNPFRLTPFGERLFFYADDGIHGWEPWISDGTAAGTLMLIDLVPGPDDTSRFGVNAQPLQMGNLLYFIDATYDQFESYNPPSLSSLYVTDGTTAGTRRVSSLIKGVQQLIPYGDQILLITKDFQQRITDLWVTDGETEGVYKLGSLAGFASQATIIGETIYLDVWLDETSRLYTLEANGEISLLYSLKPGRMRHFVEYQGALYFVGGGFLHRSDGTPEGTVKLAQFANNGPLVRLADQLLFLANYSEGGYELWASDGSAAGTRRIHGIPVQGALEEWPDLVVAGNRAYFGQHGLWYSDGTADGTSQTLDNLPIWEIIAAGERVMLIVASGPRQTSEVWVSDGLTGARRLFSPPPPPRHSRYSSLPDHFTLAGPQIFFRMGDEMHGDELWVMGLNVQPAPLLPRVWMPEVVTLLHNDGGRSRLDERQKP